MPELKLSLVQGDKSSMNGKLERRIVVNAGDDQLVERVILDSWKSKSNAVKRWAGRFGIDEEIIRGQLESLARDETARVQTMRAKRNAAASNRVLDLVGSWLNGLSPKWHRRAKTIYLADPNIQREVAAAQLWTLADQVVLDAVANTLEGCDLEDHKEFRQRLGLFKDAVALAAPKLIKTLPRVEDVERDETLDPETLRDRVTLWLLRPRTFRQDNWTPVTTTYYGWALAVAPDEGWQRCFGDPVFACMGAAAVVPEIGVKGEWLLGEMTGYETVRRLLPDLREAGIVNDNKPIRVTRRLWRVWVFTADFLSSISTHESEDV